MKRFLTKRQIRKEFRDYLDRSGSKGAYTKAEYKKRIRVHYRSLCKYLDNYNEIYSVETRKKRKEKPSIKYVFKYFIKNKRKMLDGFIHYLQAKTHFSYDIYGKPKDKKTKWTKEKLLEYWKKRTKKQAYHSKLGEFVVLILAEYVILHNYMWAGRMKMKGTKTIDRFMEDI